MISERVRGEGFFPAEKEDVEKTVIENYEYKNENGEVTRVMVEIATVPSAEAKERLKQVFLEKGSGDFWARELAHLCFPAAESKVIRSLKLETVSGGYIDILEDCNLKDKPVYVGDELLHSMVDGFDGVFIAPAKTPIHLFVLPHENGHVEQLKDSEFVRSIEHVERIPVRRGEDSAYERELEVDANRRGWKTILRWKELGADLTGRYVIDPNDPLFERNPPTSDTMTIQEFIAWQQASRGIANP